MALFSMVGIIGFSASSILYGKAQLFPDGLLTQMGSFAAGVGLLVILLANLTTNVAANLVSPSYDFSQVAPSKISFRTGGLIAAVIGLLFMPWKLLATSGGYLFTWLGGYGTLLGAINLTDEAPPRVRTRGGYDSKVHDPRGRMYYAKALFRF
jgi:NCS1 family nucleobase:cation symporter-1